MTESDIQHKIIKHLESRGAYVVKIIAASKAGVPDLLACYKGKFIAIEVKKPKGVVSPLQKVNIETINNIGGIAIVARKLEHVELLLGEIDGSKATPN